MAEGGSARQWAVTHIPGEPETGATTGADRMHDGWWHHRAPVTCAVRVLAASINPKLTSLLIRELHTKSPLPMLSHVKRVRRTETEAGVELSIILCTADGEAQTGGHVDVPTHVSELVEKYSLQPFLAEVPEHAASSREEWEAQCPVWPTSFHPNACARGGMSEVSEEEAGVVCKFMEAAIHQARLAHSCGQPANGAVIVDPFLGCVIASGHDETAFAVASSPRSCQKSKHPASHKVLASEEQSTLAPLAKLENGRKALNGAQWHPLRHAVMVAIDMAAARDRSFFPSDGTVACAPCREEESGGENLFKTGTVAKKARIELVVDQEEGGKWGNLENTCGAGLLPIDLPRPYLCTGFDAYVTREPCAMCAMALVHQRVRRVFYGIPNASGGALGSKYRLHGLRSLNHHYTVFQVAISADELVKPL